MLSPGQTKSIIELLEKAGDEIMRIYRNEDFHIRIKEDDSPVTMADLASDSIIKSGLNSLTPNIPVFSEETKDVPYSERSLWKILWILDPLDGTKEFIARSDEFCISLALVKDHKPVAGFIHSPVTSETWVAEKGKGAYKMANGVKSSLPLIKAQGPYRVNISRTHHSVKEEEWIRNFSKENEIIIEIYGSAVKFCKIAEGYTDLYPKLSLIHEWDIAAGHLIIEESGGRIIEPLTGNPPVYNKEDYHQPPFVAFGKRVTGWKKWITGLELRAQSAGRRAQGSGENPS
jgi:3'(2'), 5'-bisphosphate nucleotidase